MTTKNGNNSTTNCNNFQNENTGHSNNDENTVKVSNIFSDFEFNQ